jgi:hypothetical protein
MDGHMPDQPFDASGVGDYLLDFVIGSYKLCKL